MHAFRFRSALAKPLVPALAALSLLLASVSFVGSAHAAATAAPISAQPPALQHQRDLLAQQTGTAASVLICWGNVALLSETNKRYVWADLNSFRTNPEGALLASSATPGSWGRFNICRDPDSGLSNLTNTANGKLVSAELGYGGADYGMLRARATLSGEWEWFKLSGTPGSGPMTIQSRANNLYVSAEMGYSGGRYGMLRARANAVGPWEQFELRQ